MPLGAAQQRDENSVNPGLNLGAKTAKNTLHQTEDIPLPIGPVIMAHRFLYFSSSGDDSYA